MLILVIANLVLGVPPSLQARCDPNDPTSCVQPLLKGEAAPFAGQLLTFRRAAILGVAKLQLDERIQIEVELARGKLLAEIDGLKTTQELLKSSHQLEIKMLMSRLDSAMKPVVWYEKPLFVAVVAVVATTVVYVGAVKTVEALK